MVKISMEVCSGAARFAVGVQAESIQRAVSLVRERYPKGNVRVKVPNQENRWDHLRLRAFS